MIESKGLAFKLTLVVSVSVVAVFLLIFGFYYRFSRGLVIKDTEQYARSLGLGTVSLIESVLRPIAQVPETLAASLANAELDESQMRHILKTTVENNPDVFGCGISFEPYGFDKTKRYFALYYHREGGAIKFQRLGGEDYRYFNLDWYQIPKELGHSIWTEPYLDLGGGGVLMTSYCVPFYRGEGGRRHFSGVVTVDVSLSWLNRVVSSIKILKSGDGFLISKNGTFVTHHIPELIMNRTIFSMAEERRDPHLRDIGRRMISGGTGFTDSYRRVGTERLARLFYAPVPSTGWSLAVVFPLNELMADVRQLSWIVAGLAAAGLVLLVLLLTLECRSITRPLREMALATEDISAGHLDGVLPPVRSQDEVGRLTEAFGKMRESLKAYIQRLTETVAAKERIESELSIAREIQMSSLPKVFPPMPGLMGLELHALLVPAREVGGDLYDFYPLGNGRFCFLVGDVSGKGVPAALFMAMTKTLLKTYTTIHSSSEEILARANNDLCSGNDRSMFATLFLGILDLKTGELEYSNAGHNRPFILRASGALELLDGTAGPPLGAFEGRSFPKVRAKLSPGDRIFLYTDGVTEAESPAGEFFGDERLERSLRSLWDKPPKDMLTALLDELNAFSKAEHSDDITLMAFRYDGPLKP